MCMLLAILYVWSNQNEITTTQQQQQLTVAVYERKLLAVDGLRAQILAVLVLRHPIIDPLQTEPLLSVYCLPNCFTGTICRQGSKYCKTFDPTFQKNWKK